MMRLLRPRSRSGAVSIETVLIIACIALPVLIFMLRFGWPRVKDYFNEGMADLEAERSSIMTNQ